MTLGLEALLFVLLGLQAPQVADAIDIAPLALQALAVALVVVAVRMAWALLPPVDAGDTLKERIAVGWSGMRGAISLAAALAVPAAVDDAPADPADHVRRHRRHAARPGPDPAAAAARAAAAGREPVVARRGARPAGDGAGGARPPRGARGRGGEPEEQLERLREVYRARFEQCVAALDGSAGDRDGAIAPSRRFGDLRRDLIGVERRALLDLRAADRVPPDVLRRVERELDLEESRLRA